MNQQNRILLIICVVFGVVLGYRFIKRTSSSSSESNLDKKILIVGTNDEYPPFSFSKEGMVTGFDIDVIKEVSRRLGMSIEFKNMSFDALIPQLQLGQIHVIAAGLTPTQERAKTVLFTTPHFEGSSLVIVSLANGPMYRTVKELEGKRVAVNQGYFSDTFMSSVNGPEIIRLEGATISSGILALESNRADAYVTSRLSLQPLEDSGKLEGFNISPIEGTDEKVALAISKQHPDLLKPIQNALDLMKEDGTLQALEQTWKLK